MAIFTISDLHLSFSCDKPMDVFGGKWKDYTKKLEEYWRYMVNVDDTVIIPGDISWAMDFEEARADFQFLEELPGEKIILKGNHDYWWATASKLGAFLEENGFKTFRFLHNNAYEVEDKIICGTRGWICEDKMTLDDQKVLSREAQRFLISLECAKKINRDLLDRGKEEKEIIAFFHYPVLTATSRENPITPILSENNIRRVFYGHLHNVYELTLPTLMDSVRYELVSCDYINFTPMRIN